MSRREDGKKFFLIKRGKSDLIHFCLFAINKKSAAKSCLAQIKSIIFQMAKIKIGSESTIINGYDI